MPALNLKAQFAPLVADGRKLCTMRRNPAPIGATAYLFTGMRTKSCKRLGSGTIVHCVPVSLGRQQNGRPFGLLNKKKMTIEELMDLAHQDGFADSGEMVDWFSATYGEESRNREGGLDIFTGYLITWELHAVTLSAGGGKA